MTDEDIIASQFEYMNDDLMTVILYDQPFDRIKRTLVQQVLNKYLISINRQTEKKYEFIIDEEQLKYGKLAISWIEKND
jgi:hypothetical protein